MKRITIRDVAREAGVSVTLVSFVLNAKKGPDGRLDCPVNPETAERVLKTAKSLGYRKNVAAASLRSGKSNTIAVITTDISNKFFAGVSRHIEDAAYKNGYTVLFASSDESAAKLQTVLDSVLAHNIDGVIVAPVAGAEESIKRAVEANLPVVLLDRDIDGMEDVGKVLLDDVEAGRAAADYLHKKGYDKIEMVSYDLSIFSLREREEGYVDYMTKAGLADNIKIHHVSYEDPSQGAASILDSVVERGVQALFLPTYSISAAIMMAMNHRGMNLPDDLALVGFDDSNIYNVYNTAVPHIVQPLRDLGEMSVQTLLSMINGGSARTTILKPIMIV